MDDRSSEHQASLTIQAERKESPSKNEISLTLWTCLI